jgi:hypothetical protein
MPFFFYFYRGLSLSYFFNYFTKADSSYFRIDFLFFSVLYMIQSIKFKTLEKGHLSEVTNFWFSIVLEDINRCLFLLTQIYSRPVNVSTMNSCKAYDSAKS